MPLHLCVGRVSARTWVFANSPPAVPPRPSVDLQHQASEQSRVVPLFSRWTCKLCRWLLMG